MDGEPMKNGARKAGVFCGAAVAATMLATTTATQAAEAQSSALIIGGIYTPSLSNLVMRNILGGRFRNQELVSVEWPAEARPFTGLFSDSLTESVNVGIESLTNQIQLALDRIKDEDGNYVEGERVTVVGLSAGNLVVDDVLRNLQAQTNAPPKEVFDFYTVEDTTRQNDKVVYNPILNYTFRPPPVTQYDLVTVTGEYDGFADFPQRWWNLLAVANAVLGEIFVHVPVMFDNLDRVPEDNITVTTNVLGGVTTNYFVRQPLPLVIVFPFLLPIEPLLRTIVDAGYTRDAPDPNTAGSPAATPSTPTVEEDVAGDVEQPADAQTAPTARTAAGDTATAPAAEEDTSSDAEVADDVSGDAEVVEDVSGDAEVVEDVSGDAEVVEELDAEVAEDVSGDVEVAAELDAEAEVDAAVEQSDNATAPSMDAGQGSETTSGTDGVDSDSVEAESTSAA
ncbi:PE-PPE domain-containing protein [Mycobacterium sp. ITM-2016-00317]|uniref:PE-PPE domain-containing protein n=1 Tax=Mycobacterium sp. ITM-2016-00317 TaxID=2099694 RepID=UPI00287FAD65|nr:PE-PPE domain-containing protein [Mycobacterium sp. ITM-2016-00317]WNG89160.1 PE-PPE domain-containing protein [Mycobacterium sp. ITM-2016-00317]